MYQYQTYTPSSPVPNDDRPIEDRARVDNSPVRRVRKVVRGRVVGRIAPARVRTSFPTSSSLPYRSFKTAFDIVGATSLLLLVSPIMLSAALAIKVTSPGPVIFRQRRLTRRGKIFTIYKFRTMRVDAEVESGAVWAKPNDPRITPIGTLLRMTRMDELPQLFNVLKGDMSLIGPRPERPEFAAVLASQLPGFYRRLHVKAGLTGLAQVGSGYSACLETYRKKLALDRLYIQRRSVLLDLWITSKTIYIVLTGQGAR